MKASFLCSIYQYIYIIIVSLISIRVFNRYNYASYCVDTNQLTNNKSSIVLLFAVTLFIGLRPVDIAFVDMIAYDQYMSNMEIMSDGNYSFETDTSNLIFDNLINWWAIKYFNHSLFFLLLSAIYFIGAFCSIKLLFSMHYQAVYLIFLAAFSTFSYGTNGIKAGAAASLFLMALAFDNRKDIHLNKLWTIVFILLSWGFHHAMQLPVVAFLVCKIIKAPKYYLFLWCLCVLMSLAHITSFMSFFQGLTDERGFEYLAGGGDTVLGFRFDFVIYSMFPILIGYYALNKRYIVSERYNFLLNFYTLTNAIWVLCMYANFNNRIAFLSWFVLPIVLVYPLLNEQWGNDKFTYFRSISLGHLCFTLFMVFIYYGFIHELLRM